MREIRSHTALRGIAALLVVFYHYRTELQGALDPDRYTGIFASAFILVDLFFVLSGFILAMVYSGRFATGIDAPAYRDYLQNRIARIYPLHILTMLVMLALVARGAPERIPGMMPQILANIGLYQAWGFFDRFVLNFPAWSVSVEWAAYLVFPFLVRLLRLPAGPAAALGAIAATLALLELLGFGLELQERFSLLRGIPAFTLGMLIHRGRGLAARLDGRQLALLQAGTAAAIVALMHLRLAGAHMVPLFALLVLLTWEDRGPVAAALSGRWLAWLGLWSYSVYLLHIPVRSLVFIHWGKIAPHLGPGLSDALFVLTCLLVTLAASALVYRWFEVPMRNRIRGWGQRGGQRGAER